MAKTSRDKIINYQAVLREVAKNMVRLKRPERLLKMITRYIDREIGLSHTSILVFHDHKKYYRFIDSKGIRRVPVNLVRIDADNPLVKWFRGSPANSRLKLDYLSVADLEKRLKGRKTISANIREEIEAALQAMQKLKAELVVPGYFKSELLSLLMLGRKRNGKAFREDEIDFFQTVTQDCSMALKTAEYHQGLEDRNKELGLRLKEIEGLRDKEQKTYYEIMRSLAQEVYAKDPYTFGHLGQVERLGIMTAQEMGIDLTGRRKAVLSAGLILHDVGKIGIPDHILNKPGPHTPDERKVMESHVEKGAAILEPLTDFQEVAEIVHCHHEHYDGSGYPRQLKGDRIPVESRIVSVVDAFHAIVSTRCYSKGRSIEFAFEELRRCGGTQFDPGVVEAFISGMEREMKRRGSGLYHELNGTHSPEPEAAKAS